MAYVAQNGNDSTASVNGSAFATVEAAVVAMSSYVSSSNLGQVFIYPGQYAVGSDLSIPTNMTLKGSSSYSTQLFRTLPIGTTSSTLVTMNPSSRIEDLQLILTTVAGNTAVNSMTAVGFPGTSSQSARLRRVIITVDNTAIGSDGSTNVYGIVSNGTGVPTADQAALRAVNITVNSNNPGQKRCILLNSSSQNAFNCRDITMLIANPSGTLPSGSYSYICAEVASANTTSSLALRNTTIVGLSGYTGTTIGEISQTSGNIIMAASDMSNSYACGYSFTSPIYNCTYIFGGVAISSGSQYLVIGLGTATSTAISLLIAQKTCIFKMYASASSITLRQTLTLTVMNNGTTTPLTLSLSSATGLSASTNNLSATFQAGSLLSVQATLSGSSQSATNVYVSLSAY